MPFNTVYYGIASVDVSFRALCAFITHMTHALGQASSGTSALGSSVHMTTAGWADLPARAGSVRGPAPERSSSWFAVVFT